MSKEGEIRILKADSIVWSISNQCNIKLVKDSLVEITHIINNSYGVFGKPKQLICDNIGQIPCIIGIGTDEWGFLYSDTLEYKK